MPDLWGDDVAVSDFEMPGDEQYDPAVIQAAEEAAARSAPEQLEVTETPPERPRDEQGRFTKTEESEDATEAQEQPETPSEEQPELILGKFKTHDDLATAYQNLEREFTATRQTESDELRALREQYDQLHAWITEQQQPAPAQQAFDADAAREWLDQNPTHIQEALRQGFDSGNDALIAVALKAWETHDEHGAEQARIAVATAKAVRAMQQQQQHEYSERAQLATAWQQDGRAFFEAHPDADQHFEAMQAAMRESPAVGELLRSPDPRVRREVLDFLYTKATAGQPVAAGNQPDPTVQIARDLGREQALAAEQAIKDATVASATTTAQASARAEPEAWDKLLDPLADGWNIS